jgi:hypothetical protein
MGKLCPRPAVERNGAAGVHLRDGHLPRVVAVKGLEREVGRQSVRQRVLAQMRVEVDQLVVLATDEEQRVTRAATDNACDK